VADSPTTPVSHPGTTPHPTATGTATAAGAGADPSATDTGGDQGGTPPSAAADEQSLGDSTPTDTSLFSLERGSAAVDGVQYDDALRTGACYGGADGYDGYAEYNLGKAYRTLDVVIGLDDNSPNAGMTFTVLADGKRIFRERATVGKPFHPRFDVSGVLRLRVEWVSDSGGSCPVGVLGDPTLIP
ncbi:MAG: hypothetical protein HOY69_25765, partial [Streptomyces sp.]|nr:hypothetical protein [Streptomyces sp.]